MTTATPITVLPGDIRVTDDLIRLVRNPPPDTVAIVMDPNDGELRAFTTRERGEHRYHRVFPNDRYSRDRRSYADLEWERAGGVWTNVPELLAIGWTDIPLDLGGAEQVTAIAPTATAAERIEQLRHEIRRVQDEHYAAIQRTAAAERALRAFEEEVSEVATKYANENDNRSQVEDLLSDLGLELGDPVGVDYSAELTITVQFNARRLNESYIDEGWVQSSLEGEGSIENAIRRHLGLDSDNEDFSINDISFEITSAQED